MPESQNQQATCFKAKFDSQKQQQQKLYKYMHMYIQLYIWGMACKMKLKALAAAASQPENKVTKNVLQFVAYFLQHIFITFY